MKVGSRITMIILSTITLLNVMFVPVFEFFGGLIPDNPKNNFFTVLARFIEDTDTFFLFDVQFTLMFFIPAFLLFIFSMIGSKGLCIASSVIGIAVWVFELVFFAVQTENPNLIFDFNYACVSIGSWIALAMFFISFIISLCASTKKSDRFSQYSSQYQPVVPYIPSAQPAYRPDYGYANNNQYNAQQYNAQQYNAQQYNAQPYGSDEKTKVYVKKSGDVPESVPNEYFANINQAQQQPDYETMKAVFDPKQIFKEDEKINHRDVTKTLRVCPNCNSEIDGKHAFCGKCGCRL